jgi:hypothetical protein
VQVKSKWIEHKGKRIFFADYSGFQNLDAFKEEADYSTSITITQPDNSVLLLVDVTGTIAKTEMVDYITESANKYKEKMKKTAVVGVSGYRRIFLRAVVRLTGMSVKDFNDIEEAKDWLAQDD